MKKSTLSLLALLAGFFFTQSSYALVCGYGDIKQLIKDGKFDEAKASIDQCQENKSEARRTSLMSELYKAKSQAKEKEQKPAN